MYEGGKEKKKRKYWMEMVPGLFVCVHLFEDLGDHSV